MSLSNDSETERLNPGIWKVTSVAVLGSFLAQIDATVVNVSLSSLAVELHSSLAAIQWVTSGYLLALALVLPLKALIDLRLFKGKAFSASVILLCALHALLFAAARRLPRTLDQAKEQGHEKTPDVSNPALLQAVEALVDERRI